MSQNFCRNELMPCQECDSVFKLCFLILFSVLSFKKWIELKFKIILHSDEVKLGNLFELKLSIRMIKHKGISCKSRETIMNDWSFKFFCFIAIHHYLLSPISHYTVKNVCKWWRGWPSYIHSKWPLKPSCVH